LEAADVIRVPADQFTAETADYLEKVQSGEDVWIERDGKVIAKLVAEVADTGPQAAEQPVVLEEPESELVRLFREARKGVTLGGLDWKELRDEGRH